MAERTSGIEGSLDGPIASRWGLWLGWVIAGTVGWGVGAPAGVAVGPPGDVIVVGYLGIAVGGILTGVLQWLLLRRQMDRAGRWVMASVLAVAVVGIVVFAVGVVNADVGWVTGAGLFGAVVGTMQWLALRLQVDRAGWWVVASTLGWIVGGAAGGIVGGDGVASWTLLGALYGAITGGALVWLLNEQPTDSNRRVPA